MKIETVAAILIFGMFGSFIGEIVAQKIKLFEGLDMTESASSICIGDVEYWLVGVNRSITPKINPETLSFLNCGK